MPYGGAKDSGVGREGVRYTMADLTYERVMVLTGSTSELGAGDPVGGCRQELAGDVVVLGSTGSIGTQALDVVRANPDLFRVVALTAGGSNPELFEQQCAEFRPAFSGLGRTASSEAAAMACDVVLNGITGVGLRLTLAALDAYNTSRWRTRSR